MQSQRHPNSIVGSHCPVETYRLTLRLLPGSELLRFVHRPELIRIDYTPVVAEGSPLHTALKLLVTNYDFSTDPYILDLVHNYSNHHNVGKKIEAAYLESNTYCFKELKSLLSKYESTAKELGVSVADWCLIQCIAQYEKQVSSLQFQQCLQHCIFKKMAWIDMR